MMATIGNSNSDVLDGYLKQQCMDPSGLFVWERKLFTLDIPNCNLFVKESDTGVNVESAMSLRGVKYAKEWSFSSSVSGFGFDLVWFSGKLWSFFADDERMCKTWVDSINYSISIGISKSAEGKLENYSTSRPPLPPKLESRSFDQFDANHSHHSDRSYMHDNNNMEETKIEDSSPRDHFISDLQEPHTAKKFSANRGAVKEMFGLGGYTQTKSYDEYDAALRDLTGASVRSSAESHEHRSIQQQIDQMNHPPAHHPQESADEQSHHHFHHNERHSHSGEHHDDQRSVDHRSTHEGEHIKDNYSHAKSEQSVDKHSIAQLAEDEASSVRSQSSSRQGAPDHVSPHSMHTLHSIHRVGSTSSAGKSNIEQRMLFGNTPTPAAAAAHPVVQQRTPQHQHEFTHPPLPPQQQQHHQSQQNQYHDQNINSSSRPETFSFPSALAEARIASEKELIAHSMSLDRPSAHIFAQEVATLQSK